MLMLTVKLFIANSKTNYTGDSFHLYLSFNHIKASHFLYLVTGKRGHKRNASITAVLIIVCTRQFTHHLTYRLLSIMIF